MKTIPLLGMSALVALGMLSAAQAAEAQRKNFVACPIVRDTEMVPCWLTEYEGELYYLGIQQDLQDPFFPPQLKHKALVEGVVSDKPRICGGIVLDPVKVSVIKEVDLNCVTVLPAEGYEIKNARRGVGPDPGTLSQTNQARDRAGEKIDKPYTKREYTYYYDYDDAYMPSRSVRILQNSMRYAKAIKASKVEVIATRGAVKLSDGSTISEKATLADLRASEAVRGLVHIGVPREIISSRSVSEVDKADGVDDFELRRTTIVVTP